MSSLQSLDILLADDNPNMRAIVEALTAFITELLLNADEQGLSPAGVDALRMAIMGQL